MPFVYLMLIIFTLGFIWLYLQTSEDIPKVLAGLTGIACLIWGFSFAHWSVQILVVFGLLRLYRICLPKDVELSYSTSRLNQLNQSRGLASDRTLDLSNRQL